MSGKTLDHYFDSCDIKHQPYRRGPLGKEPFALSTTNNILRWWEGDAEIYFVNGSKKHRQCVLEVIEQERTIQRDLAYEFFGRRREQFLENLHKVLKLNSSIKLEPKEIPAFILSNLRRPNLANVAERNWRNWRIVEGQVMRSKTPMSDRVRLRIRWQANLPPNVFNLLVGFDETAPFVCATKQLPSSVTEAHQILRGKVPAGSPRQGEWFFVRASKEISDILNNKFKANLTYCESLETLERNSSHLASEIVSRRDKRYVRGYIIDSRKNHHKPLFLKDWHEVVRNQEIVFPRSEEMSRRTRYWD